MAACSRFRRSASSCCRSNCSNPSTTPWLGCCVCDCVCCQDEGAGGCVGVMAGERSAAVSGAGELGTDVPCCERAGDSAIVVVVAAAGGGALVEELAVSVETVVVTFIEVSAASLLCACRAVGSGMLLLMIDG